MEGNQLPGYKEKYFAEQAAMKMGEREVEQERQLAKMIACKSVEDKKERYSLSAATDTNEIWHSGQYKKEEWRQDLNQSLYKKSHD